MTDATCPRLVKYAESPVFTEKTIPEALRRDHQTKKGVWGRIVVAEGELIYRRRGRPERRVAPGDTAMIYPEELHYVAPRGHVRFTVEFLKPSADGAAQ